MHYPYPGFLHSLLVSLIPTPIAFGLHYCTRSLPDTVSNDLPMDELEDQFLAFIPLTLLMTYANLIHLIFLTSPLDLPSTTLVTPSHHPLLVASPCLSKSIAPGLSPWTLSLLYVTSFVISHSLIWNTLKFLSSTWTSPLVYLRLLCRSLTKIFKWTRSTPSSWYSPLHRHCSSGYFSIVLSAAFVTYFDLSSTQPFFPHISHPINRSYFLYC